MGLLRHWRPLDNKAKLIIIPSYSRNYVPAWCQWLTPVILATKEAQIRKITV
jgi:hypothetical protein